MPPRRALPIAALVLASAFAGRSPAPAQEGPAAPVPLDALRASFRAVREGQERVDAAWKEKDETSLRAAREALGPLQARFRSLFAAADWEALDPAKDRDLLAGGLMAAGQDALRREDGGTAVRAFEALLAKFPAEPFARAVSIRLLPSACLTAGRTDRARELWTRWAADPDPASAATARLALGDLSCAAGDLEGARAAWRRATEVAVLDAGDAAGAPVRDARVRLDMVGARAPEIDGPPWIGAPAVPLSSLAGRVVVVDFWASWCAPCRASMPRLDRLHRERGREGLVVLGVTRPSRDGFLPAKGTRDPEEEGVAVPRIPEDGFEAHLEAFRANLGLGYPFVVADAPEFEAYRIVGLPTRYVVDREGKVAFVQTGGGDEALLRAVVDRLLARKK